MVFHLKKYCSETYRLFEVPCIIKNKIVKRILLYIVSFPCNVYFYLEKLVLGQYIPIVKCLSWNSPFLEIKMQIGKLTLVHPIYKNR